jgi:hypothetical protein
LGRKVHDYFQFRASVINGFVESHLMNVDQARALFEELQGALRVQSAIPLNKQTKEKSGPAYFTAIVNMLIEHNLGGLPCNYNPQELTTITKNDAPFRTLARRVDGAFPSPINPIAVWEIKEYYHTTTFGSRVADGVYESLLDGMEIEELDRALHTLNPNEKRVPRIQHLLMIDAYYTWWIKGRSYLCRIVDMLHMGYVDEVLFGSEVVDRIPKIVQDWTRRARRIGLMRPK